MSNDEIRDYQFKLLVVGAGIYEADSLSKLIGMVIKHRFYNHKINTDNLEFLTCLGNFLLLIIWQFPNLLVLNIHHSQERGFLVLYLYG